MIYISTTNNWVDGTSTDARGYDLFDLYSSEYNGKEYHLVTSSDCVLNSDIIGYIIATQPDDIDLEIIHKEFMELKDITLDEEEVLHFTFRGQQVDLPLDRYHIMTVLNRFLLDTIKSDKFTEVGE